MTVRFVRPVSTAAFVARRLALAALLLLAIALLAHRFGPLTTPSFVALVLLSAAIAALSVPLAMLGLIRLWQEGARGGVASVKALIYAVVPLGLTAFGAYLYLTLPRLYDVSTDIADPPAWVHQPAADQMWLTRPSLISPVDRQTQGQAYPGLTGRRYEGGLDRIYEAVLRVGPTVRISFGEDKSSKRAKQTPATKPAARSPNPEGPVADVIPVPLPRPDAVPVSPALKAGGGDLVLQGEGRSLIFGFRFDVLVRMREEAETTLVDVRVASRYGPHDLGFSAALADNFLRALDAELLGIAGN